MRDGLQQAMDYAQLLDILFAYSSNGDEFVKHDFLTGKQRTLPMAQFPTPQELEHRRKQQYTAFRIIHRLRTSGVKHKALNADILAQNPKYIRQITGDQTGKNTDLEEFCDVHNEGNNYPVIAVTSKLMTTGVNSKTCRLVVLDANIQSMTEFKQTIGRGIRLRPDAGKAFFTIMDFRGNKSIR